MRITVYIVRHAECQSNINPDHDGAEDSLTEKGCAQAIAVADQFKGVSIDVIYTSNILRARQTGQEIERVTGIQPVAYGFLKEVKASPNEKGNWEFHEPYEVLIKRLADTKALLEQVDESRRHIVVVSHAIFLKALLAYLLIGDSLTPELLAKMQDVLVLENAGISTFVFNSDKNKWRIMGWNDKGHLDILPA